MLSQSTPYKSMMRGFVVNIPIIVFLGSKGLNVDDFGPRGTNAFWTGEG